MQEKLSETEKFFIHSAVVVRPEKRAPIERYFLWAVLIVLSMFLAGVYLLLLK